MSTIVEQIVTQGIHWHVMASDWRELTRRFGAWLVDSGLSTGSYTEAMIKNVEDNGPYLVIAPGVALLHARPDAGALKNAVVVGTVDPPVNFGHSTNDPVWLVLALTATGDLAHTELLQGIALMLAQDGALERLHASTDEQTFITVLETLESGIQTSPTPAPPVDTTQRKAQS